MQSAARATVFIVHNLKAERARFATQAAYDGMIWVIALVAGFYLRTAFVDPGTVIPGSEYTFTTRSLLLIGLAAYFQIVIGRVLGLYVRRWRYGTFEEIETFFRVVICNTGLVFACNYLILNRAVPSSVALASGLVVLSLGTLARYMWRLGLEAMAEPTTRSKRALVFGAGSAGRRLVNLLLDDPSSDFWPVGIIDDDPTLGNLRIRGARVCGGRDDIIAAAERTDADTLLIAVKSPEGSLVRDLSKIADQAGLEVLLLPSANDILTTAISTEDIRPVTEADLLGRREIDTDIEAVADYLTGKRVLVTGAGGSIGSELCRQINRFGPDRLVMLDRDETALHDVQLSIDGRGLLDSRNLVVANIRDAERVEEVFAEHRPHVVFHAAALKHLPLLELHPSEGFKTNVLGTLNVLEAAGKFGVDEVVNVSTDKAADPTSVLGRTKRLAERLTAEASEKYSGKYMSVRFGNVLGSRGSVLPTFRAQLEAGGPITVTHPDVSRYFMTVEEACQLVIQAGAIGERGQALVLDMGEPVKIIDVARRLVSQSERPVEIVFTGLRPGEKMHEVLQAHDEVDFRPRHPLISHVDVPSISGSVIRRVDPMVGASADIDLRPSPECPTESNSSN